MADGPISRRRFLAGTGAFLGASAAGLQAQGRAPVTVSLIHTTDLHGHILPTRTYTGIENVGGLARCATRIRQWRREHPESLLLDIGDVYQGTAESHSNDGALMVGLFNRLGYDAWTPGNHDFDWGPDVIRKNLALSKPAVLASNLSLAGKPVARAGDGWESVKPWTMKTVAGFRIALIGIVTPGLPYWLAPETLGGIEAAHPAEALQRCIAEATAEKADAIVLMAHMGWRDQDDFANPIRDMLRKAPGAHVLLAGHTHQDKPSWKTGSVLCSQASYYGIHCGKLDLHFDPDTRKLVSCEATTSLMDSSVEQDPAVLDVAAPDLRKSAEQLARTIGQVTRKIQGQGRDNELAELFCTMFSEALERNQTPVDGVFHGTFGTGDLEPGDITIGDCWKLLPYENLLTTVSLGAREIIEILKEERSLRRSDRILSHFELKLNRAGDVTLFEHKGKAVAEDARFTIAMNSYDAQSGGQTMMRLREIVAAQDAKRSVTPIDTRSALIDGILNRKQIP